MDEIAGTIEHTDVPIDELPGGRPTFKAEVEDIDRKANRVSVVVSDMTQDRDGEKVDPKGWKLGDYKKNPRVLWLHDAAFLPVGRGASTRIKDGKLKSDIIFAMDVPGAQGSAYDFVKTVGAFFLADPPMLDAISAGFEVLEWKDPGDKETYRREPGDRHPWPKKGRVISKQSLWEFSVVPLPANPNAVREQMAELKAVAKFYLGDDWEKQPNTLATFLKMGTRIEPKKETEEPQVVKTPGPFDWMSPDGPGQKTRPDGNPFGRFAHKGD